MTRIYTPPPQRDWTSFWLFVGGLLMGTVLVPLFIGWSWVAAALLHGGTQ